MISPDGARAYAASRTRGSVSVIDTASNTVVATVDLGGSPWKLAMAPSGGVLYAAPYDSGVVSVIDTATNTVTATIPGWTAEAWGIAVDAAGATVYATDRAANVVRVIDTATNAVTATISGFASPSGLATNGTPATLYAFTGFFPPVDNLPVVNEVRAGRPVPIKFGLGGDQGLEVFRAGYPAFQQHDCDTGEPVGASEPGTSTVTYDAATSQYAYMWRTDRAWAGQCRTLLLGLRDGSTHQARFALR